ncbi:histone deacetylase, putative (HDA1), partial [Plasmodium ovale curtisi]
LYKCTILQVVTIDAERLRNRLAKKFAYGQCVVSQDQSYKANRILCTAKFDKDADCKMEILKDKRNIRYEYELDKLKKKKKDNILILNIINNKINYICYILKSDYRSIINDVNYENKNSMETCFYYCKSYISFLLLYYPYIHNYVKCLRNNNLRIYKNFYKCILNMPNNFHSLIFKLRILDEVKEERSLGWISHIDEENSNQVGPNDRSGSVGSGRSSGNTMKRHLHSGGIGALLTLNNAHFSDNFSKDDFIKILFSRIYVKKYHKRIFKIMKIILFYYSLPIFTFSRNFFEIYHNRVKSSKLKKKCTPYMLNTCRREKRKRTFKRLYFKTPFFEHVHIPTIYLDDYYNNMQTLVRKKLIKIKKKKKKCKEKTGEPVLSDNSGSVSSDKSLSCLTDSEEEKDVNAYLKKHFHSNNEEEFVKLEDYNPFLGRHTSERTANAEGNTHYRDIPRKGVYSNGTVDEDKTKRNSDDYDDNQENNYERTFPKLNADYDANILSCLSLLGSKGNEKFTNFVRNCRGKDISLQNVKKTYGNYILEDIQNYFLREKKGKERNDRKTIYLSDMWEKLVNFNDTDDNKNTLIHKACLVSNTNIIFLLLNLNVNLVTYNDKAELPLHCTLYNCDRYIFLLLLHNTVEYLFFSLLELHKSKKVSLCGSTRLEKKSLCKDKFGKAPNIRKDNSKGMHGMVKLEIEGEKIAVENTGETRGVTDYSRKVYCQEDSITCVSTSGNNMIGMMKGNDDKYRKKYFRNNFFYYRKVNKKFVSSVIKLYLSVMVKIIELGNFEFLKILFNYNKHIFCYILHTWDMFNFVCSVASMYNCLNKFINLCDRILRFNGSNFNKEKKKKKKRKKEEILHSEEVEKIITFKKRKKGVDDSCSSICINCQGKIENVQNRKDTHVNGDITSTDCCYHPVKKYANEIVVCNNTDEGKEHLVQALEKCKGKNSLRTSGSRNRSYFINGYIIKKKINKNDKIEIFYSNECAKHIFVPEPSDHPYLRNRIKSNIPENSSRLDVLISDKHGILKSNTFVNFKLKRTLRKATASDILRVHDISYLKMLLQKMKKCTMDEHDNRCDSKCDGRCNDIYDNFLEQSKKTQKNYLETSENHNENDNNEPTSEHLHMLRNNNIISSLFEGKKQRKGHLCKEDVNRGIIGKDTAIVAHGIQGASSTVDYPSCNDVSSKNSSGTRNKRFNVSGSGSREKMDKLILLDNDTFVNKHSFNCALNASGVVLKAIDYVYAKKKKKKKIFCVVRPPGHHLGTFGAAQFNLTDEDRAAGSQGFCILNNIAIGISYAKYKYEKFEKIAIIDFDIHHGNGTEQIIRNLGLKKIRVNDYIDIYSWKGWRDKNDKKNIFFSSIHAFDGYFYPGTGNDTVELEPYIINVTLKKNMDEQDFLQLFHNNILIHLYHFKPNLLFLSAGFDGHKLDYVNNGFVKKNTSTYFYMTNLILSLQNKLHFPIISVLEGGYNTSNDMASVFSLSVLEHLLSFYYNDTTFTSYKRQRTDCTPNRGKIPSNRSQGQELSAKKRGNNNRSGNCAQGKKTKKACNPTKNTYKKKNVLKFPHICVGKSKMEKMFKNYFTVFKEKTKETDNLNLTDHVKEYDKYLNEFDKKQKEMKCKINNFLAKHGKYMENVLNDKKMDFSNMKIIKLPYESYFYEILSHLKINLKKEKNSGKKDDKVSSQDVTEYFSLLNNPSDFCPVKSAPIQQ